MTFIVKMTFRLKNHNTQSPKTLDFSGEAKDIFIVFYSKYITSKSFI